MGSLPRGHTGVGSATNGTFMQVGGALGVAVIGSLLTTRYQDRMTAALAPYHVPHAADPSWARWAARWASPSRWAARWGAARPRRPGGLYQRAISAC